MKRLNPDTGKPFVCGDTRADGFLFWGYTVRVKKNGYFVENWYSPNIFEKTRLRENAARRNSYHLNIPKNLKRCKDWRDANPVKVSAQSAKKRAVKRNRTPPWLTQEHLQQIESVYALAKQLTVETGIVHHVDHIVPLQGKTVSGLHVPWNLRAIPATENLSKSNRLL